MFEKILYFRNRYFSSKVTSIVFLLLIAAGMSLTVFLSQKSQDIRQRASEITCIPSGDETAIIDALHGNGAKAVLCKNAVFSLQRPIRFTEPNQELYTEGLPTDDSRALLKIVNPKLTYAINGLESSGIQIKNIKIDGNRTGLGRQQRTGEEQNQCHNANIQNPLEEIFCWDFALIQIGGNASGQVVDNVMAFDPRSWSALAVFHGNIDPNTFAYTCTNATITNNTLGPAGWPVDEQSDGISLSCNNSIVRNNTIIDATDGGIVIFGSPGSLIQQNTIKAITRNLYWGIAMVDYNPNKGNYEGTIVDNNTIIAESAMINNGIGMGKGAYNTQFCTDPTTEKNRGATVTNNILSGRYMGYGYVVNGVNDWTVMNNTSTATNIGTPTNSCDSKTLPPPMAFAIQQNTSEGTFQPEFTNVNFLGGANYITSQTTSWLIPHCNGPVFDGCTAVEDEKCGIGCVKKKRQGVCSDYGTSVYANWNQNLQALCATVCNLPDPNTYCAPVTNPTPTATPTIAISPTSGSFVCTACNTDINKDGGISVADYSSIVTCFDKEASGSCVNSDINKNGVTDIEDYGCVINMFGQTCSQ